MARTRGSAKAATPSKKAQPKSARIVEDSDVEIVDAPPSKTPKTPKTPKRRRARSVPSSDEDGTPCPTPSKKRLRRKGTPMPSRSPSVVGNAAQEDDPFQVSDGNDGDTEDPEHKPKGSDNEDNNGQDHSEEDDDGSSPNEAVYRTTKGLDKKTYITITKNASTCKFKSLDIHDKKLLKEGFCSELPVLPDASIVVADYSKGLEMDAEGNVLRHMVDMGAWASMFTKKNSLNLKYLAGLVAFDEDHEGSHPLVNPGCADVMDYQVRTGFERSDDSKCLEIVTREGDRIPVFVSVVACVESMVLEGKAPILGKNIPIFKYFSGVPHRGLGDRGETFFAALFNQDRLVHQLHAGGQTFQTRNRRNASSDFDGGSGSPYASPVSKSARMLGRLKLSTVASSSKAAPSSSTFGMAGLDFQSAVPVYDATGVEVAPENLTEQCATLPRWTKEIPSEAPILVAYNVQATKYKDYDWKLVYYVRFAVIIAQPPN